MAPYSLLPQSPTPTPSRGLLALSFDFSFKPVEEAQAIKQHHTLHSAQSSDEQVTRTGRLLECSKMTDVMQNKQNKDQTNML